jgi:predicted Zn finger-like uncharacterized protein
MKIVCDACQAKYSISDDKVQGKVFKIRCKKCSNIIVVRGGANVAEAAPPPQDKETHVYDYGHDGNQQPQGDDAVWHVVINQDQVGPMTAGEVGQRFAGGEIDAESYIWREGFADWLPLAQVEQFQGIAAGGHNGGGREAVSAMFGGGSTTGEDAGTNRSDPGDLFAAASASSHAGRGEDDGGGDLFGSQQAAAQRADAGGAAKLRGERNENSVLFSLNNLAQLASDKPAPSAAMTSMPSGHATGAAGGEGSGLIDIRSMASAYLGSSGATVGKSTASVGSIDDLPVFGGGGFSEPAVIVPTARAAANNKILYVMIGAVGLLAVAAVIMVVVLIKGGGGGDKDKPTQVAAAGATGSGDTSATNGGGGGGGSGASDASGKPAESTTTPSTTSSTTTGSGSGGSATQVAVNDTKSPTTTPAHPTTTAPTPHPATHTDTPHPSHTTTTTTAAAPPAPAHHDDPKTTTTATASSGGDAGGCDEVSCLLGTASGPCCAKYNKKGGGGSTTSPTSPKATPPPSGGGGGGDLPETLDRDMISNGVGAVSGAAHACSSKAPGVKGKVKVHVKVSPAGTINGVDVSETPDPALGNCVAGAMSRAHFAKTQKGGSFSYPFVF